MPLATPRVNALLLAVFALTAAALAGIGLFSVMATMVRLRTRELGLRLALGATSASIRWMVLARGLAIAVAGGAAGMAAALLTNSLLSSLLYEVNPTDLLTVTAVAVVLLSIALVATLIPAHTSARIEPSAALRSEG
ncbi:MAG: FtsX-like permease family protein [Gemmatimonadaceae bacterium]|nr:FtsX-like permease family protein [Gemmatimonadaceae bacterium]